MMDYVQNCDSYIDLKSSFSWGGIKYKLIYAYLQFLTHPVYLSNIY
jgi:hypothetical protein